MKNPELDKKRRIKIKNIFHKYDDGKSAERVFNEIINLLQKKNKETIENA
jgi:CDP-glycerol glycerophosphotransferase (TagB/SpsB family)